jgi:hypothetical protein
MQIQKLGPFRCWGVRAHSGCRVPPLPSTRFPWDPGFEHSVRCIPYLANDGAGGLALPQVGERHAFLFHEGYWGPQVGFCGGINYGYRYRALVMKEADGKAVTSPARRT